jgi:Domain of unknown function (DUF6265)
MKKLALFLIVGTLVGSCKNDPKETLKEIDWLSGKWTATVDGNTVEESWSLQNDTIWMGESAFMREGKALFTEKMSISLKDDKFHFVTAISDQNDGSDIIFTQRERSEGKVTFENKKHDFPQLITYESKGKNEMLAYISGKLEGKPHRIDFKFSRMK